MASSEHRTTARILDILETIASVQDGVSLSDLSRSLSIPKSSLHPLLCTLAERRYLHYLQREERYYLGESVFVLGNKYVNNHDVLEQIKDVLQQVNQKTGETLYFGVLSKRDVLYLAKADLHSQFRVVSNPGNKLPAYSTGYGKALLSQFLPEQIRELYPEGDLKPLTPQTVRNVEQLNTQLEGIRATGFAYEKGESTTGIQCVAVAIEVEGQVLAGMSIAVPEFRYTKEREEQFKTLLDHARSQIQRIIAGNKSQWIYSGEYNR
nr:IclR family transcriptional regulator [uncultured Sphaerochaeta sp.]